MMTGNLVIEQFEGWARVRIDREAKRNALDRATRTALTGFIANLPHTVRAVVLTGTGGSFCAGLDLKERAADRQAGLPDTAGQEAIALNIAMREHRAIFIAAVNGLALGGGMTLVNCCDLALAASDAEFGTPEIAFATYASMAGPTGQMLINRKRAAWMLLNPDRLSAQTACDWGLINEVTEPRALQAAAEALASRLAGFDGDALAETKSALNAIPAMNQDWEAAMQYGQTVNTAIRSKAGPANPEWKRR